MFFVFAIISFSIAYGRAKATGRNGYLWGTAAAATFIGTGLTLTFGFSVLLSLGMELWELSENTAEKFSIPGAVVSVVASFGTTWLILRKLRTNPEKSLPEPPPPPVFNRD